MARETRIVRDREPNWKLAFGSGSFLLVWVLGLMAGVPLPWVLMRACVAAGLGLALGAVVGMTLKGLRTLAHEPPPPRGGKLDVMVQDDLAAEMAAEMAAEKAAETEATKVVPQAPADPFQPIDFKQAAKHVQGLMSE
ncbi:MAG: hypothetical protein JWM80_2264 [Cyanobacteria bacterium RYN_339]|nr:hypothetical protein [Cyanobacteria bacterium RYN_339]